MPSYTVTDPATGRTLTLTGDSPPTEQELEDIFAQSGGTPATPSETPVTPKDPYANDSAFDFSGERNIFGAVKEAAKAPSRGFFNTILGSVEGTAELVDAATNFVGLDDLIDSGDENAVVWAANAGKDWINKESGAKADPRYQDLWTTKFGEGVGSFASFLTPTLVLKGASILNRGRVALEGAQALGKLSRAEKIATGAFAATSGAGEAAQRAKAAREEGLDVSEGEEDFATAQGALVGLTEMLPISRILGRVPKNIPRGEKDYLVNLFKSAGIAAAEEGGQEVGAAVLQNMIERGYNPNQEIFEESLMDDLTVGGAVGALADITLNAFAGRRKGYMTDAQKENERKAREIEARNDFQFRQEMTERKRVGELIRTDPEAFNAEAERVQGSASSIPAPTNEEVMAFNQPSAAGAVATPETLGELYSLRIVGKLGSFFPTNTSFTVEQGEDVPTPAVGPDGTETVVPQPSFKVVDSTGKQYGQALNNPDVASSLARNLNGEIVGQSIRGSILGTLMTSPQGYNPEQSTNLFRYGFQTLNPESNNVTYAALNDAAGTTTENGYIEEVSYKDILNSPKVLVKGGAGKTAYQVTMPNGKKRLAVGLTASQELNRKREAAGLPPVNSFNIRQAREALGGNIGTLGNPSVTGIQDQLQYAPVDIGGKPAVVSQAREVLTKRKTTLAEKAKAGFKQDGTSVLPDYIEFQSMDDAKRYADSLNKRNADKRFIPDALFEGKKDLFPQIKALLESKNIDAEMDSDEVGQLVKSFTGARDAKSMSLEDQKLFYARLRNLPGFSTKTKLPVFRLRPYSPEQFVKATQYQQQNPGAVTDEGLATALGLEPTSPRIAAIKSDLQKQTDARLQKEVLKNSRLPLVEGLRKALDDYGLSGVNLRLEESLRGPDGTVNEGYFDRQMDEVALAIDGIDPEFNTTDEGRLNYLKEVLSHEVVHALRALDLWTAKEWDILSQAAARTLRPQGSPGEGKTFLAYAQEMYSDMSVDIQVEESVAELARAYIANKKLIGGKPRNLIERMIRLFQRLKAFVTNSGYQNFEAILNDMRSGAIASRDRGEVRSLRLTKNVPEGYVVADNVPEGAETRTISDFDEAALEGADIRESRKPYKVVQPINKDTGRRYSVKDISKLRDEKIPLNVFAEQFADRIKQSDTKLEDANRIAEGFIKEFVDNPSSFLPVVQGDKLSVDAFLRMPDGTMYDPEKLEHADATDQTIQIYNAVKNGTIRSALGQEAVATNNRREEDLSQLSEYLNGNADYSLAEQALIMKGASKFGMRVEKGQFKLVPIADNNQTNIAVLTATEASAIAEELRKGKTLKAAMLDGITSAMKSMEQSNKEKGLNGWKTFKKSDSEEDAAALKEGCAGRKWCTASATSTARSQLQQGDFHVYYKNGEPIVALRTEDGKLAEPPRGSLDGQFMTAEEEKIAEEALRAGRVTGGEDYLHDRDLIADVMAGKHKSWPDLDLFLKTKRKYKVGYGRGQYDLPKPVIDAIEKERNDRHTQVEWVKLGYTTDDVSLPLGQGADFKYIGGDLNITGNPTATVAWLEQFTTALSTVASNLLNKKSIVNVDYIAGNAEIGYRSSDSAKVVIGRINGTAYVRGKSDLTVGESNDHIYVQDDSTVNVLNKAKYVYVGTTDRKRTDDMVLKAKLISSGEIQRVEIRNHGSAVLNKVKIIGLSENANATVNVADDAIVTEKATLYAEKIKKEITVNREATAYVKELGTEKEFANTLDVAGDATIFIKSANISRYQVGNGDDAKVYIKDFAIKDTRSAVLNYEELFIKEQKNKQRSIAEMVSPLYVFDNAKGNFYTGLNATVKIKNLEGSITVDDNAIVMIENGTRSSSNRSAFVTRQQNRNSEVRITNSENFIVLNDKDSNVSYGDEFVFPSEYEQGMYVIDQMFPDTGRRYSRKSTQSPIEDAVSLANEKYADYKTASKDKFFEHWNKLLNKVGTQLSPTAYGTRVAAKKAIADMEKWIKNNERFADYYDKDMIAVKKVLAKKYGKVTDEDMMLFQMFAGLTSPNTALESNINDALALLDLYKTDGNLDQVKMGISDKNNIVIEEAPFTISGTTNPLKARTAKIFERIIKEKGSVAKAVKFLHEPVSMEELEKFKLRMGYKELSDKSDIMRNVESATGQSELIPRMFVFGPKVGAYSLNLTGNRKYTTIDIWESRFIRSYFDGLFEKNNGLPVTVFEHDLFNQFNQLFKEEFDKITGQNWNQASLQAMRWFYIINATNKAGYTGASTNDTISGYTDRQLFTAGKGGSYRRGESDAKAIGKSRKFSRKSESGASESSAAAESEQLRYRGGVRGSEGLLRDAYRPYQEAGRAGRNLAGLPNRIKVGDRIVEFEGFAPAQQLAEEYMKEAGVPYAPPTAYVRVDKELAAKIADEFQRMPNAPEDPLVQASYRQMMKETAAQYRKIMETGLKVEFIKGDDPYGNPRNAILDVIENNHLWVFSTQDGFGTNKIDVSKNPLLEESEFKDINGQTMLANDLFRVVHDYFGHIMNGVGFRADGEENAWRSHASMYSPFARRAMTVETRGQNSWLNFGPNGEFNRTASPADTIYADQKVGLLPEWVSADNYNGVLEKAVEIAQKDTDRTPKTSVPLYGPNASPEALYVALNPEMGAKLSVDDKKRYSRRENEPQYPPNIQKLIDQTPQAQNETMGQTFIKILQMPSSKDFWDKIRQGLVYRGARLERQYRENPELAKMMADTSANALYQMTDHARAITQAVITGGIPVYQNGGFKVVPFVYKGKNIERGLLEIMAPLHSKEHGNLERLAHRYAMAIRGERLNNEGKLTPIAPGELQALEAEIQKYRNPATGQPVVREWYDMWQAYNSNIVKYLKDTGVIDDAGAQLWMKQSDYIPFYREKADGTLMHPKVFGGLHTAGQFKAVGKSSEDLNVDMVTAIVNNIDTAIAMGMKNVAQQRIIRDQINLGLASVLKKGETVGDRNSVSFKIAGKRYTAIIEDPLIYESMLPANEIPMDGLFGTMFRFPANLLRELIIRDPGYMVANMFRDTLSSYVITGAEVVPLWGTAKGFAGDIDKLRKLGVIGGYDLRMDKNGVRDFYDKEAKKMGMVAGVNWLNPVMAAWDVLGRISERSEAATRLAVYEDILKRTGNEVEAQYQALSVMNYGRRGNNPLLRMITALVPFLNARIQGLDKLYQATTGRVGAKYTTDTSGKVIPEVQRRKNFARFLFRAGLITGITALYYAMVSDDDEYENASPEIRDNYYIIPVMKGDTESGEPGLSVRLPIPFEIGIMFKVIPERLIAGIYGDDTSKDFKDSMSRALVSTLGMNPIPQAILPIGEAMVNKDFYTGRPVVPTYMENLLPEQQKTFYTNVVAEDIANKMGFSPMKVDHVLRGYGGTLGGYFMQAIDSMARENEMVLPATEWYQKPFIKRFFATANQPGLQNKFYELKDDVDGITQTINRLNEEGRYDELATFYAKNGHMYEMRKDLNYLEKQITRLRDQRKIIEQMDIDPESKRQQIEQINMMISATLTSVPMYRKMAYDKE